MQTEQLKTELNKHDLALDDQGILLLVPMAVVAWADGNADVDEMESIARKQCGRIKSDEKCVLGITPRGRRFYSENFLYKLPNKQLTEELLDVLARVLSGMPPDKAAPLRDLIADACLEVAHSSGGIFGAYKMHGKERRAIAELANRLKLRLGDEAYDKLEEAGI